MHPPLRSVNRETHVGDTRRPTGIEWIDPSVHLPPHAAHSLIHTNKPSGLTVIIVGFSITLRKKKKPNNFHLTVNADVHPRPFMALLPWSSVRCRPPEGSVARLSDCCGNFPEGIFLEKQEERRLLIPTVSVEPDAPDVSIFGCYTGKKTHFFDDFKCVNKSESTCNTSDLSF